jgi:hypothetical protein
VSNIFIKDDYVFGHVDVANVVFSTRGARFTFHDLRISKLTPVYIQQVFANIVSRTVQKFYRKVEAVEYTGRPELKFGSKGDTVYHLQGNVFTVAGLVEYDLYAVDFWSAVEVLDHFGVYMVPYGMAHTIQQIMMKKTTNYMGLCKVRSAREKLSPRRKNDRSVDFTFRVNFGDRDSSAEASVARMVAAYSCLVSFLRENGIVFSTHQYVDSQQVSIHDIKPIDYCITLSVVFVQPHDVTDAELERIWRGLLANTMGFWLPILDAVFEPKQNVVPGLIQTVNQPWEVLRKLS